MAGEFDWLSSLPWGNIIGGAAGYAGAGGDTTVTKGVAPEFKPLALSAAQRGMDIGAMPYQPYEYNRTANFTPDQFAAFDLTRQQALNSRLPGQAEAALGGALQGNTMQQSANPYLGSSTGVGSNPYAGANPYLEQNIQQTLGDISTHYNQNVAPTMAATAYKSGAFGNTGQQEMENQSRNMLQRNLGSTAANMRMQDYGMQQGLAESDIARRMAARQGDLARNAGLYESGANRAQAGFDSAQQRVLSGLNLAPSVYGMGYAGANALGSIGTAQQNQAQNMLNTQYQDWQTAQDWPFKTGNYMNSVINGGGAGSSETAPGTNPWAGLLGGSMLGGQLWKP